MPKHGCEWGSQYYSVLPPDTLIPFQKKLFVHYRVLFIKHRAYS